jgi:hypothetical protein
MEDILLIPHKKDVPNEVIEALDTMGVVEELEDGVAVVLTPSGKYLAVFVDEDAIRIMGAGERKPTVSEVLAHVFGGNN